MEANASNVSYNPALVNEPVKASLSAMVPDPPSSGSYGCTISGPSWQWSIQSVLLIGAPTQVPHNVSVTAQNNNAPNNSPNSSTATLSGTFGGPGSWTVNVNVEATYSDNCGNQWKGSATVTLELTVIAVSLSPNPVVVPVGYCTSVTVTTAPSGYESAIALSAADSSIAGVSGSSPNFMVVGVGAGSTNLLCYYQGRPCPVARIVYVFTANLVVSGVGAGPGQKLNPGGYVPLNANNNNGSAVTNGIPATRDMNISPIANEKDLVSTILKVTGLPANWPVSYTLSIAQNGHGRINVWNTPTKQSQFALPYTWSPYTANAWPNCYLEGVAEGYAEREITLTLQVNANGSVAPSTDVVKVTVTPILKDLQVMSAPGAEPGLEKLPNTQTWVLDPGADLPAGVEVMTLQASALKTGIQGDIALLQNVQNKNNLKGGFGATVDKSTNRTFDFAAPYTGKTLLDAPPAKSPYFWTSGQKLSTDNDGVETITDYDSPSILAKQILPQFIFNNPTSTVVDVSENFTLYAVWKYPDGTYYALGQVTWSWRVAGTTESRIYKATIMLPQELQPRLRTHSAS